MEPCLEFSFTKFNFGKCFLYSPGMVPACQTLVMTNKGIKGIRCLLQSDTESNLHKENVFIFSLKQFNVFLPFSVQSQFKENAFLEIDFQPDIVPPGGVVEVPIYFYPRELCHYHKKITFVFNSCILRDVEILGQGVKMKVRENVCKQLYVATLNNFTCICCGCYTAVCQLMHLDSGNVGLYSIRYMEFCY